VDGEDDKTTVNRCDYDENYILHIYCFAYKLLGFLKNFHNYDKNEDI